MQLWQSNGLKRVAGGLLLEENLIAFKYLLISSALCHYLCGIFILLAAVCHGK